MNTEQEIYGWHIIHAQTGLPYAFCAREVAGTVLTEDDVLDGLDPELFVLVPLVRATLAPDGKIKQTEEVIQ